jgi:hypothetical protein
MCRFECNSWEKMVDFIVLSVPFILGTFAIFIFLIHLATYLLGCRVPHVNSGRETSMGLLNALMSKLNRLDLIASHFLFWHFGIPALTKSGTQRWAFPFGS